VQSRGLALGNVRGVGLDGGSDLGGGELLDLLGSTADESRGVQEVVQLGENGVEEGGAADALEQVVVLAVLLDVVGGLVGEDAYRKERRVLVLL
jgi:hypothetical protein